MKLEPIKFGLALALAAAIAWVICSVLVALLPGLTLSVSEYMFHADLSQMAWQLTWGGVIIGLVLWSVIAGIFGWLLALTYNCLQGES